MCICWCGVNSGMAAKLKRMLTAEHVLVFSKDGRGPAYRWSPRWCAVWSDQKTPAYSYPREHWALLNFSTRWIRRSSAAAALRSWIVPRMDASTPTMLAYNAIDIKTICCTQNQIYNPEIFSKMTVVPLRICGSWSVRWAEWSLSLCSARHRSDRCCRNLVAHRRGARSTRRCRFRYEFQLAAFVSDLR